MSKIVLVILLMLCFSALAYCNDKDRAGNPTCDRGIVTNKKYLIYDVNPGEGFNLRRDVYMRVAVLIKNLRKFGDWILVLPPWAHLPHWRSKSLAGLQNNIPWGKFFELDSMKTYIPVMELKDLIKGRNLVIDHVLYLQHFKDAWVNGKWEEKYQFDSCHERSTYKQQKTGKYTGWFWSNSNIMAHNVSCLSFQGHAKKLIPLLASLSSSSAEIFMIDRAEILLHDDYGNVEYWKVRRSMRFAPHLYLLASDYRKKQFSSNDELEGVKLPQDWREETGEKIAIGGDYICGHLRRQDFLYGRPSDVPSLRHAAKQLKRIAQATNITHVFIASDGTGGEMNELREYLLPNLKLFLYAPSQDQLKQILDGGAAIVEQIICSRARYFIGSHESTFSFRIQEEREILNFPPNTTFNRFCGNNQPNCEQPAKWTIKRD